MGGDGNNQSGAGYTPNQWSPYNVASLGSAGGSSQSYPCNKNDLFIDGSTRRTWNNWGNVNEGGEQDVATGLVEKLPAVEEIQNAINRLKQEMDEGNK